MKINEAKNLIKSVYKLQLKTGKRVAIELVSGPGMGKSSIVKQAASELSEELGVPFLDREFMLTTVEPPDVRGFGLPFKQEDGSMGMQFTRAPWMPRVGDPEHGFVFLDEKGQAGHDVLKPAAELLLNGRVGDSQLPITYMVLAASNRETDRSGVQRELAFVTNRRMLIKIEPNLDAWVSWAEKKEADGGGDVHPLAIAFARTKPAIVFQDTIPEKSGPFCTPRSLCMLSTFIGELDMATFTECAAGLIGEGAAAEFVAFLRVAEELPKFEDIVANPTKEKVPSRADASYAAMQMLAHRVDDKTAKSVFTYLKRMQREFQVAGLKGTFNRCPKLVQTPDFAQWLRENKDLVMAANLLDRK